ncbi:MAG: hypothetical protein OXI13_09420, partial [Gammaproteobacteria bacterium]|nr:hypothetical protein [Gammaproteobacteria bacterium]
MNTRKNMQCKQSRREREHAELLERALARPGIPELMKVYDNWQEKDRGLSSYRSATKKSERTAT